MRRQMKNARLILSTLALLLGLLIDARSAHAQMMDHHMGPM
jgi:hypothetical protein